MKFTDLFIRRPVLAASISLIILLLGLRSWFGMTVREYPTVTSTTVTVTTSYPGADPETVKAFITGPLEQTIAAAPGIDYMTATSAEGVSTITVNMKLNYDPNAAISQIMSKVDQVRSVLPPQSQAPLINETVGDTTALMYLAFSGGHGISQQQVDDYLLRVVQPKIQSVSGVSQAQLLPAGTDPSGNAFALRIWLDPTRMAALGITPDEVSAALKANNSISAIGMTRNKSQQINITANTSLNDPKAFGDLVVKDVNGTEIRLKDIGKVGLGAENYNQAVFSNGRPAVFIGVQPTPDANDLSVAKGVHKAFAEIQHNLPPGISAMIAYDSSTYIIRSIHEVVLTTLITLGVVVVVIFLFLGSLRSLLMPVVAIPLSVIGAGLFMLASGFSINLLTLLAVVLAIGLVVDDAIIVVENVHRHIEEGMSPRVAAMTGARELASPLIVMTTTLVAVFAPIGFMGGLTGSLFTQFAFTLVFSVTVSMIVALTLTPMLSSRVLVHTPPKGFVHFLDASFEKIRAVYDRLLHHVLRFRLVTLVVALIVFVLIPFLFIGTKSELAPTEDQGIIFVSATGPSTATLHYLNVYDRQIRKIFDEFPETGHVFQISGLAPPGGAGNYAIIAGTVLKDWNLRHRTQMQIFPLVQAKLQGVAGLQAVAFERPPLPGSAGGLPVQFVLTSPEPFKNMDEAAKNFIAAAMKSGKFAFLMKDLRYDDPQTSLVIDRHLAANLGISMQDISNALSPLLSENYIERFNMQGHSYEIIPQVPDALRSDPQKLNSYYVRTSSGELVPLSTVVKLQTDVVPPYLPQFNQLNAVTVQGVMAPGVSLGQALSYLRAEVGKVLPSDYSYDYASQSRQFVQQGSSVVFTFLLSIILVYLLLAAQFESFRDPLIVLITVPMSVCGALIFLYFGFASLNIYTEVGLVTLIGLITKQGILIVQFANQIQEHEGLSIQEAVQKSSSIRLRPILMTTAAMVFGVVPLLLAHGPGAVSRFDMGLVIASGLSIGALFSLFVVPVIYTFIAERKVQDVHEESEPDMDIT
ncbi:MAG: efflux RND transporter permease subunit [Proteobacteria bacterium]|nr:efflux RND transporter permease subunit [Pseudomonadota bacterium]MDE3207708.1 efflux RND transporter permease subunit [Pseudomonadota bacterium]